MHRRCLVYVAAALVFTALILPRVEAQAVGDFLKRQTQMWGSIANLGPPGGSQDNPPHTYHRVCTKISATQIACKKVAPKLPSGGDRYGPIYWIASDPAPVGFQFQSAKFRMPRSDANGNPETRGVRWCYGDESSPVTPGVPKDPETDWRGHRMGIGRYAICWAHIDNANMAMWYYSWQGSKEETTLSVPPNDWKAPLGIDTHGPGVLIEPAELDYVYVKIP